MTGLFEKYGPRLAIISKGFSYTYKDLTDKINLFLTILKKEIPEGSVVAMISGFSFESVAMLFALAVNKNIIVPIVSEKESNIKIEESKSRYLIIFENGKPVFSKTGLNISDPLIFKLRETKKSGLVLFTSGSTGRPKALLHDFDKMVESYKRDSSKDLNTLVMMDFDHIGGIDTLCRSLGNGSTITIPEDRSPQSVFFAIEKNGINVLPASPAFLSSVVISEVYKKYNSDSLRIIAYGAEPMPQILLDKLIEIFPKADIQQKFGTSETNAIRIISKSKESLFFRINDENAEFRIVNDELWIKSNSRIIGYLNSPEQLNDDGWFRTGDIVEQTDDGFLKLAGRKNDIINVGGNKLMPQEVENVIFTIKGIMDCRVYGEPNLLLGQNVVAEIVIDKNEDREKLRKSVREECSKKLERFKIPTKIIIVEEIKYSERLKKVRTNG